MKHYHKSFLISDDTKKIYEELLSRIDGVRIEVTPKSKDTADTYDLVFDENIQRVKLTKNGGEVVREGDKAQVMFDAIGDYIDIDKLEASYSAIYTTSNGAVYQTAAVEKEFMAYALNHYSELENRADERYEKAIELLTDDLLHDYIKEHESEREVLGCFIRLNPKDDGAGCYLSVGTYNPSGVFGAITTTASPTFEYNDLCNAVGQAVEPIGDFFRKDLSDMSELFDTVEVQSRHFARNVMDFLGDDVGSRKKVLDYWINNDYGMRCTAYEDNCELAVIKREDKQERTMGFEKTSAMDAVWNETVSIRSTDSLDFEDIQKTASLLMDKNYELLGLKMSDEYKRDVIADYVYNQLQRYSMDTTGSFYEASLRNIRITYFEDRSRDVSEISAQLERPDRGFSNEQRRTFKGAELNWNNVREFMSEYTDLFLDRIPVPNVETLDSGTIDRIARNFVSRSKFDEVQGLPYTTYWLNSKYGMGISRIDEDWNEVVVLQRKADITNTLGGDASIKYGYNCMVLDRMSVPQDLNDEGYRNAVRQMLERSHDLLNVVERTVDIEFDDGTGDTGYKINFPVGSEIAITYFDETDSLCTLSAMRMSGQFNDNALPLVLLETKSEDNRPIDEVAKSIQTVTLDIAREKLNEKASVAESITFSRNLSSEAIDFTNAVLKERTNQKEAGRKNKNDMER